MGSNVRAVVTHSPSGQKPGPTAGRETERIDEIVEFWRQENPELDVGTKCLSMRLRMAARLLEKTLRQELSGLDIEMWELEMLLSLRRAPGLQRSAGALMQEAQVTSGAITNRLSRLEARGWVRRDIDLNDRRHIIVTLTSDGLARADEVIAAKNVAEQRFCAGLPRETLARLSDDLRALLAAAESSVEETDRT